ncbi:KQDN repeat-containing protein [Legionella lansingensis]|uniref:KQDN repeat-containing protein n=1 Tax=Legionella lansingensis TaxID=45067 RepID=A0A0W0VRG5_9GAMM|nr:BatD family protein [Legionella lansingensis]KTD22736.1 KQDN repeat-containing protein [Legionella lansingensis]SNV56726.1 KQDN repeat-containing protein [Legionella lansingensis]
MRKILLSLFLLGCYGLAIAAVTMQLETTQISLGEPFKLVLSLDGDETDSIPDLTPLQDDFEIIGTERSVNYTVINGRAHSVSQWIVLLMPKKTGTLTIPPIQVGQEKTNASQVEVKEGIQDVDKVKHSSQQDVMLLAEVDQQNPYINQQVILTVKLYSSSRLLDAAYQPPKVEDALIVSLGPGRRYQTSENGRIYVVEEQQYAIFPQKSGRLNIHSASFHALIYDDIVPKKINEETKPIVVDVKPIASQYTGKHWLPAKEVSLTESYDNNATTLEQGSTLVRTVTLRATALPAQLLPALDFANSDEFSVYPEKPSERSTFSQGNLIGTSITKVTYLLNKSGQMTIPALKLTWFNTLTGKEDVATLPEHTIQVKPLPTTSQSTTPLPSQEPKQVETASTTKRVQNAVKESTLLPSAFTSLAWWLAGGFACAWLLTLGLWFWQKRHRGANKTSKEILKHLQRACLDNNPHAARDALIQWAQWQWPQSNVLNLAQIENMVSDKTLQQAISGLSHALYHSNRQQQWAGASLWMALLSFKHSHTKTTIEDRSPLPPMHKLS